MLHTILLLLTVAIASTASDTFDIHTVAAIHSLEELEYDENDRLASHGLLFADTANCRRRFEPVLSEVLGTRFIQPIDADLAQTIFNSLEEEPLHATDISSKDTEEEKCYAICLEQGSHRDHVGFPLPYMINEKAAKESLKPWLSSSCQKKEVGFLSYYTDTINIFWVNAENRVNVGQLKYGERNTIWQTSYLGHVFELRDAKTDNLVAKVVVNGHTINPIGKLPSLMKEMNVATEVDHTFRSEWGRAHRVKRTFTEYGFDKGKLPLDIYGSMSTFYYHNRDNKVIEEWNGKGLFVNWWENDCYFIPVPTGLKSYWQKKLKLLVEAWSGVELEETDIYGLRQYESGARLLTHVDREATHAASLIINVAQFGLKKPWPVEIYDFGNRLHEIEMEEGDIIYYESARCLHGRMQALAGGLYVNLFAHYRPKNDPKWYTLENPKDAPKQVIDVGECTSNGTKVISCSKLDSPPPHLSPSLAVLKDSSDLFSHWKKHEVTNLKNDEL